MPNRLTVWPCPLLRCEEQKIIRSRPEPSDDLLRIRSRHKIHMLPHMQIQPQLIGDAHRHAVQSLQRFGQSRFEIAADLTEVLDGQPGHAMRRIDQGPAQ